MKKNKVSKRKTKSKTKQQLKKSTTRKKSLLNFIVISNTETVKNSLFLFLESVVQHKVRHGLKIKFAPLTFALKPHVNDGDFDLAFSAQKINKN